MKKSYLAWTCLSTVQQPVRPHFVFLNVVVHQKPLFRIETLAKKYFLQAVYML